MRLPLKDVRPGDRVYNKNSGRWGLVVSVAHFHATGNVSRLYVRPSLREHPGWSPFVSSWSVRGITDVAKGDGQKSGGQPAGD